MRTFLIHKQKPFKTMEPKYNTLETIRKAGEMAGNAARNQDYSLSKFHQNWFSRAISFEHQEVREKMLILAVIINLILFVTL